LVKNGRLYGRGSADLKGGLTAAFWGLKILKDLGFEPSGDILFESIELFDKWQEMWRGMNNHPLFEDPGKELNVLLWSVDTKNPDEFTQLGAPLFTKISWVV
jgi:hypothetical protein